MREHDARILGDKSLVFQKFSSQTYIKHIKNCSKAAINKTKKCDNVILAYKLPPRNRSKQPDLCHVSGQVIFKTIPESTLQLYQRIKACHKRWQRNSWISCATWLQYLTIYEHALNHT